MYGLYRSVLISGLYLLLNYCNLITIRCGLYPSNNLAFLPVSECGGELTTSTGVIASPNFPGLYAHNRQCRWLIRAERGRKVTLTFQDMDINAFSTDRFIDMDDSDWVSMSRRRYLRHYGMCNDYVQVRKLSNDRPSPICYRM